MRQRSVCVGDEALSLDGNQLTYIFTRAFHGISGLLSLSLHNNNISLLDNGLFSNLRQLTTLLLHDNKLGLPSIAAGVFDSLVSLTYIDLSSNQLKSDSLHRAFLRRSTSLRHVYLDDNQLSTLDPCLLAVTSTHTTPRRTLSLLANPIHCDCSLTWLLTLRYNHHSLFVRASPLAEPNVEMSMMSVCVCLSVCQHIPGTTRKHTIFTNLFTEWKRFGCR